VTECLLSPCGTRAEAFLVRNYRGDRFRFEAEEHVLATGTIEVNRLLLASRSVNPEGVGNFHGQVGRYMHDHVSVPVAEVRGEARHELLDLLGGFFVGSTKRTGRIEASSVLRQRLGLLAVMAHLIIHEPEDSGAFVARELFREMHQGNLLPAILASYRRLPPAAFEVFRLAYHEKIRKRRVFSSKAMVTLCVDAEQRPSPRRVIQLADQSRDRLDMAKAIIDWRVSSEELATVRKYTEFLVREFIRIGIVGIHWYPDLVGESGGSFRGVTDTYHLMGGTVMGTDPLQSVVDTELCAHGISKLSVASLSTFPAGGSSNPTFTLIALTLRLAERLKRTVSPATSVRTRKATASGGGV
jgi:choline dehydrogenase-like flavoprotein